MNPLIKFLASGTGRVVRVIAGIALVLLGLLGLGGLTGILIAVIGAVPLLAGLIDVCVPRLMDLRFAPRANSKSS
jgi:uncharacterized membrane protein